MCLCNNCTSSNSIKYTRTCTHLYIFVHKNVHKSMRHTLPLCRTQWFKVADASMTSKSDEKEAKIAVEEVQRQQLELEKRHQFEY